MNIFGITILVVGALIILFGYFYLINLSIEKYKAYKRSLSVINKLEKDLAEASKQASLYRTRAIEVEDAIKESTGVTLRNEITKLDCPFDEKELSSIISGLRLLIGEYYQTTAGVKFYLSIIEKIESKIEALNKSREMNLNT